MSNDYHLLPFDRHDFDAFAGASAPNSGPALICYLPEQAIGDEEYPTLILSLLSDSDERIVVGIETESMQYMNDRVSFPDTEEGYARAKQFAEQELAKWLETA